MKTILFLLNLVLLPSIALAQKGGDVYQPTEPINFQYEMVGELGISFTWEPPTDNGNSTIDGYNFTSVGGEQDHSSFGLQETSYSIGKLERGATYEFYVTAYNYLYESAPSETITVYIPPVGDPGDTTPPVIVSGPDVLDITENSARIVWETDELSYASLVFDIHKSEPHNIIEYNKSSTYHEFSITGLIPCSKNYFLIKNVDEFGNLQYSEIQSFVTEGCLGGILNEEDTDNVQPSSYILERFSELSISLNQDAFSKESAFQVKKLDIAEVDLNVGCPADKKPVGGRVYDIKLLEEFNKEADLLKPADVTIFYTDEEIDGVDENSLSMYHYNGDGWQKLESCVLDKENNSLTCQTSSFSKFMLSAPFKCENLSRNFYIGSYHKEILSLKKYLNQMNFLPKYKALNNNFFDLKTHKALKEFQKVIGVGGFESRFGFLGPLTRDYINNQKVN